MKLKSLILGSIAAAGLSTAGFAADLGVLTSLDVCDELGLSGLTISSDTNCLQISGSVSYTFDYGNWNGSENIARTPATASFGGVNADGIRNVDVSSAVNPLSGSAQDWDSKVETFLKFVGTASSDFGPARVVINLRQRDYIRARDGITVTNTDNHALRAQDAYVQVGDTTILSAGKKGSIFNEGDDEPFNFTGLFMSDDADVGVWEGPVRKGGHVIQLETQFGEGFVGKIGLEALDREAAAVGGVSQPVTDAGSLIGVLQYAGSGITAHISGSMGGLLDGVQTTGDTYAVHAGITATFDAFKVRAAGAAGGGWTAGGNWNYWNGLITGEANFDMFKVALSGEFAGGTDRVTLAALDTDAGFGGSIGAKVAEGIEINIGGRYFNDGTADVADGYQVAAQLVAAVTETIKITGEIGVYGHGADGALAPIVRNGGLAYSDFYGSAKLGWNPGGGFESSIGAKAQQNGAYKVTFTAKKAFE
ncbi:hypothetical protein [Devosia sp. A369]